MAHQQLNGIVFFRTKKFWTLYSDFIRITEVNDMKLVRFRHAKRVGTGVHSDVGVLDVHRLLPDLDRTAAPGDMTALLAAGPDLLRQIRIALENVNIAALALSDVELLAPCGNPPKIICAWVNYPNPAVAKLPEVPIFFSKYSSSIIGPLQHIKLPRIGDQIVVEPELTAVIGKGGRHISREEALSHVAGYTITNDVTAFSHRLQVLLGAAGPYMMAKSFDTFAPNGPWIVTSDEIADPGNLNVRQWHNGELCTESNTSRMIYSLEYMISYLSDFFTLEPGDMILTGSPPPASGKPRFLEPGDAISIEIEKIGTLENLVRRED